MTEPEHDFEDCDLARNGECPECDEYWAWRAEDITLQEAKAGGWDEDNEDVGKGNIIGS